MRVLRRHQLLRLNLAGWSAVQARPWDEIARACLAHWAAKSLPLVVTQQGAGLPDDVIALGLPGPIQWQRRKFALQVGYECVLASDEFPDTSAITNLLKPSARPYWSDLCSALQQLGSTARVHGSHGWQQRTGLAYLHDASDLDLNLSVSNPMMADAIAAVLQTTAFDGPRLDGELVFPDGAAVAWREWLQWRAGDTDRVLVKRLTGATLESSDDWLVLQERLPC